jgi:5-methyltetrahydropteroyltriglutamate--homocysteine methyltransferase
MTASLPLIPTAVVGSHGKPGWWFASVKAQERAEFGPADLEEMFDDAADTAIRDMERAGIDIITDGEVRRIDGYVDSYYAIIKGIEARPVRRKAGPWGYDQQTRYEAVGRIETPTPKPPARDPSPSVRASIPARSTRAWSTWPSASRRLSTRS